MLEHKLRVGGRAHWGNMAIPLARGAWRPALA
jgi:hypothetical protein